MTFAEIEQALGQRLAALSPARPIAWPNKNYDPKASGAVPYIEFAHIPVSRTDDSIDASMNVQTGIALLTVVTARDTFANQANDIAQNIADMFFMGLRIATDGGFVMVSSPPEPVAGFVDGVYYRAPVRVTYRTAPSIPGHVGLQAINVASGGDGLEYVGGELRVTIDELPSA